MFYQKILDNQLIISYSYMLNFTIEVDLEAKWRSVTLATKKRRQDFFQMS